MNNWDCEGYCALAMKEAGVDDATILRVVANLWHLFDFKTEDEAYREGKRVLNEVRDRNFG